MSFPPLAGGDHSILSSEYCSGYVDIAGVWNTGFYCPQTGSTLAVYCCGTATYKYCCTDKPFNGTGAGVVEDITVVGIGGGRDPNGRSGGNGAINIDGGGDGNDYSGATRMRPMDDHRELNSNDLASLNLSDVPIIFGVACGVAAVLILVILAGVYITSCCAHYHQLHQNRKRRSSIPGIYRDAPSTNASTNSGLVNLYSPTNSGGRGGGVPGEIDNTQTYVVHHQQHHPPPASPDSISTSMDRYQMGGGSASLVTTPLDIEWSSTSHQYLQQKLPPQQQYVSTSASTRQLLHQPQQHSLNLLSGGDIIGGRLGSNHLEQNRIHYTVHQTQNRLAVALTGSMNRLSDRPSPCPTPSSSYHVNIPLTPPDGYSYPRQQSYQLGGIPRGLSPPPQYSSTILARSESPPYYPSHESSSFNADNPLYLQQLSHNYLSRTSTLPISLTRKPPTGCNRPLLISPGPYGANMGATAGLTQQPKSILRTSQNYRRVVTNDTPPPIPPHFQAYTEPNYPIRSEFDGVSSGIGSVAYRNVDSRTNLCSQPLLLLGESQGVIGVNSQSEGMNDDVEETGEEQSRVGPVGRRASITTAINSAPTQEEEEIDEERQDHFDIHDIDSDALSRLIEMDLDSKL